MSTIAGVGRSTERDPRSEGAEAARQALDALGERSAAQLLVFATTGFEQDAVISGVCAEFPGVPLAGCSGEGVIAGPVSEEGERAVAVLALATDAIRFRTFAVTGCIADSRAAGAELARQVNAAAGGDAIALLVLMDGLQGDASEMLGGLDAGLLRPLAIVGGAAGDALTFERTYQYVDGEVYSDAVVGVLLEGRARVDVAISHGCMPIGLERQITRAEGPWVHEIDGKPAWTVFRQYLVGEPEDLNTEGMVHLSVGEAIPDTNPGQYEPFLIHTPMGLDKTTGALYFPGGGIRSGTAIRVARRDPGRIGAGARACAERVLARHPDERPAFVLQFDCAGRGKQFFASRTAEHVVQPLQDVLGPDTPWIGIHTYGEVASVGGSTRYHNFTVALCAIYDRA